MQNNLIRFFLLTIFWSSIVRAQQLSVFVDEDRYLVIRGTADDVVGYELRSESGSLLPGSPAPFGLALTADEYYVAAAEPSGIAIDGELRLSTKWNEIGAEDIHFGVYPRGASSRTQSRVESYPSVGDTIGIGFDRNFRFVLDGNGQEIDELTFFSTAGGLLPSETGAPFDLPGESNNDGDSVRLTSNIPVVVDGQLPVDVGWNQNFGFRDVTYKYRDATSGEEFGPFFLPGRLYPPAPEPEHVRTWFSTTDNALTITGENSQLYGFQVQSPSGSLVPGMDPAPFDRFSTSSTTLIELSTNGRVTLDGQVKLDVYYNRNIAGEDISYSYNHTGHIEPFGPFELRRYPVSATRSRIKLDISDEGVLELDGSGQRLSTITVTSVRGSLSVMDDMGPFEVADASDQAITLVVPNGLDIFDVPLPIEWDQSAVDVSYEYVLADIDREFGPNEVDDYPSATELGDVKIDRQSRVPALFGDGTEIVGFEVFSKRGSIVVGQNVSPFNRIEANTPNHLSLFSDEPIPADFLRLPFTYNGVQDLHFAWYAADGRALKTSVSATNLILPEPVGFSMLLIFGAIVMGMSRSRRMLVSA